MSATRRVLAALAGCVLTACSPLGPELLTAPRPLRPADAIVVLGNRPPVDADGNVRPETERRVRRGVEVFRAGLAPLLVVTGGPSPGLPVEADVMADLAVRLGVPAAAIRKERRARDTADNAGLSVRLLCGDRTACRPRVIVVSNPYHVRRAARLFRCAGADVQTAATGLPSGFGDQASLTAYEYAAGVFGLATQDCARARR